MYRTWRNFRYTCSLIWKQIVRVVCKDMVWDCHVQSCGTGSSRAKLWYGVIMYKVVLWGHCVHGVIICKVVVQARLWYGVLMCCVTLKLAFVTKVEDDIFIGSALVHGTIERAITIGNYASTCNGKLSRGAIWEN